MIKFLVDAQLPLRLARTLARSGFGALHTKDLPRGNATPDADSNRISLLEARIVITKDADFAQTFLVRREPFKLLLVSMGNIGNRELEAMFEANLARLAELFETHRYLELGRETIIVHE